MRASSRPKASTVSENAFSLSSRLLASPCTAFTPSPSASNSSTFSGESSSTPTRVPSPIRASTTARPIPEPPPVTSATLSFSPSAILMRAPGSIRLFEELRERLGGLPRQALEQGGIQVDPVVQLGRVNLQARPSPDANLAHEGVCKLVGELGVLVLRLYLRLFHLFRARGLGRIFEGLGERLGGLPGQALEYERIEVDPPVLFGRVDLQAYPVSCAYLAHEGDRGLVADLGVLVFHVPFL